MSRENKLDLFVDKNGLEIFIGDDCAYSIRRVEAVHFRFIESTGEYFLKIFACGLDKAISFDIFNEFEEDDDTHDKLLNFMRASMDKIHERKHFGFKIAGKNPCE